MTSDGLNGQDYFALFGIRREFDVDEPYLHRVREKLLKKTHPDRFINSSESEKKVALKYTKIVSFY